MRIESAIGTICRVLSYLTTSSSSVELAKKMKNNYLALGPSSYNFNFLFIFIEERPVCFKLNGRILIKKLNGKPRLVGVLVIYLTSLSLSGEVTKHIWISLSLLNLYEFELFESLVKLKLAANTN